ncbi:MAG: single-stranded-DNA-specific exonuclease RecJ [Candidatus Gastranaerophilales bacterium]|nr:single-stranded-DNA-specific exonuclease RecJ [Candidatus Gastranaerophilales bacterium]
MAIRKVWRTKPNIVSDNVIQYCGGNRVLATLLNNRGINTQDKILKFLNPLKGHLSSPRVFLDMEKILERIKLAITNQENITVYGDFDADGITSTALLYLTLKKIGAKVYFYLPDRAIESHGLNTKAIVQLISKRKTKLIITVDCGISNVSEINFAKGFKTDVIITDHHEPPEVLPEPFAILNPKVSDKIDASLDIEEIQSLNYLAGVGVAFKLACALLQEYGQEDFVNEILPLAAVGTIGDVVELLDENRSIVAMGLELIKSCKHKGIQKLLKVAGIEDSSNITSENIAFGIVPRLNAAGRLESPNTAINLLISDNDDELENTISTLNDLNSLRQQICEETFSTAKSMYEKDIINNKKSIVLFHDNWHIGIIGIVASKLVEEYNKPVFLMTRDANTPNIIRCSCRSIDAINVHTVLSQHKEVFEGFGGHKMAAGFSFDETKISFVEFKKLLNKTIDEFSQNVDFNKIVIDADMELEPKDITKETVDLIDKLQPFGAANPSPLFILNKTKLNNYRMMGQNNNHLKINVSKDNSSSFDCIKWNYPNFNLPLNSEIDLLFSLKLNTFNGVTNVQLMLEDFYSDLLNKNDELSQIKFLDHRSKKNILNQVLDFVISTKKSTAIYIERASLLNQLNLSDEIKSKVFSSDNIPVDVEQLMFFDIPTSKALFSKILSDTKANCVHLMNFDSVEITIDSFVSKLSGMLKYAVSNLNGIVNLNRAAKALNVSSEIIECALNLFDEAGMIDLDKEDDENYKLLNLHPIELSKIKQNEIFSELEQLLSEVNSFKRFYLNSSVDEIKEVALC